MLFTSILNASTVAYLCIYINQNVYVIIYTFEIPSQIANVFKVSKVNFPVLNLLHNPDFTAILLWSKSGDLVLRPFAPK